MLYVFGTTVSTVYVLSPIVLNVLYYILGCSVVACSQDSDYSKFTSLQRETICFTFFHLINWFRELVTTFSVEKDPEMRAKVMIRLQTITELQCLLEDWISGMYICMYCVMDVS